MAQGTNLLENNTYVSEEKQRQEGLSSYLNFLQKKGEEILADPKKRERHKKIIRGRIDFDKNI